MRPGRNCHSPAFLGVAGLFHLELLLPPPPTSKPRQEDTEHSGSREGKWWHSYQPFPGQIPGCRSDPIGQCRSPATKPHDVSLCLRVWARLTSDPSLFWKN